MSNSYPAFREVQLLSHLHHENVICLKDIIPPADRSSCKDVYLVYELMDTDLHQIIRSPQALSNDHVSYFTYQVPVPLSTQFGSRSRCGPPEFGFVVSATWANDWPLDAVQAHWHEHSAHLAMDSRGFS
jgi:serine/threonine protein kinase